MLLESRQPLENMAFGTVINMECLEEILFVLVFLLFRDKANPIKIMKIVLTRS